MKVFLKQLTGEFEFLTTGMLKMKFRSKTSLTISVCGVTYSKGNIRLFT